MSNHMIYAYFDNSLNLNNSWVIVKKHSKNNFFYRKGYKSCLKNYPDSRCIFTNYSEVETLVKSLNENRKKSFFSIEKAANYFINNFMIANTWETHPKITNKPISLKKAMNAIKNDYKPSINGISAITSLLTQHYENKLKYAANKISDYEKEIIRYKNEITSLSQLSTSSIGAEVEKGLSGYVVENDKMFRLLYGK